MDGTMYRQGQGIEANQGIENGSWMGIPAWQWPKHTDKIPPEMCANLVANYKKRLTSVIANKGFATKY